MIPNCDQELLQVVMPVVLPLLDTLWYALLPDSIA
jgi:hypothetical protein